ncbi:unnamed protein product [Malus baccata var. baccata]
MMGDPLGSSRVSSQKQNREGVLWVPSKLRSEVSIRESNPMMDDPLGSSRVSSQKQNREGVVGPQSRQDRVTAESSPGCGGGPGRDVTRAHFP